jgi:anti-sigma-K factor RskA
MREMTTSGGPGGGDGAGREGVHGDAVPYVLGALDPAARDRFEAHAAACPDCLRELEELRPVADQLALAVPQVDPPPALVGRLLQRAVALTATPAPLGAPAVTPGAPAPAPVPALPVTSLPPSATPPPPPVHVATPPEERKQPWWAKMERFAAPIAACALAVAVFSGGLALFEHGEVGKVNASNALLSESLSLMYQPGRVGRELSGDSSNPLAKGMMYLTPESNDAVLVAYNLPRLAAREIYQVWLNNPEVEQRVSGGTFKVDDKGRGHVIVRSPTRLGQYRYCNVTREPAAGSLKPTGPRVLNGTLSP